MMHSLLPAILRPEPFAGAAWRQWRQALRSFEDLTYPQQLLLPMLGSRLSQWTADEPDAARFRGVVRMAWTRNQLQLKAAARLQMALASGGVPSALAGPAAYALCMESRDAIRAIPHVDLVVERERVAAALAVLQSEGWHADERSPAAEAMDWRSHIRLRHESELLYVHWRVYPAVFYRALQAERACFARLQDLPWNGQTLRVIGDVDMLLHCVTGLRPDDQMPWEADLSCLALGAMDWDRVRADVSRFGLAPDHPHPLARLNALRPVFPELAIPAFTLVECAGRSHRPGALWREYRDQCAYRERSVDLRGFLAFLSSGAGREWHRWQRRPSWKSQSMPTGRLRCRRESPSIEANPRCSST